MSTYIAAFPLNEMSRTLIAYISGRYYLYSIGTIYSVRGPNSRESAESQSLGHSANHAIIWECSNGTDMHVITLPYFIPNKTD